MLNTLPTEDALDAILSQIPHVKRKAIVEPGHHNKVKEFLELWMRYNCLHVLEEETYNAIKQLREVKAKDFIITDDWNNILDILKKIDTFLDKHEKALEIDVDPMKQYYRRLYRDCISMLTYVSNNTPILSREYNLRRHALLCLRNILITRPYWWIKVEDIELYRERWVDLYSLRYVNAWILYEDGYPVRAPEYIVKTPDGRYMTIGYTGPRGISAGTYRLYSEDFTLIETRVNYYGVLLRLLRDLYPKPDGILHINEGHLTKVGYDNRIVFMKWFHDWENFISYGLSSMVEVSDNVYTVYAIPSVTTHYQHFFKIDGDGNIVSRDPQGRPLIYYIGEPYLVENLTLYYTGEGDVIAIGNVDVTVNSNDYRNVPFMARLTSTIDMEWNWVIYNLGSPTAAYACSIPGGKIIAAYNFPEGNSIIVKASSGGVEWVKSFPFKVKRIIKDVDGNLIVNGVLGLIGCFIKLDLDGDVLWAFTIRRSIPYDVLVEGDYYIISSTYETGYESPAIIKLNRYELEDWFNNGFHDSEVVDDDKTLLEISPIEITPTTLSAETVVRGWQVNTAVLPQLEPREGTPSTYTLTQYTRNATPHESWMDKLSYDKPISLEFIKASTSGNYYVVGHVYGEDGESKAILFLILSPDTDILSAKKIYGPSPIQVKAVEVSDDDGLVIACKITRFIKKATSSLTIKIDKYGNIEWARGLSFSRDRIEPGSILPLGGDRFILLGNTNYLRRDGSNIVIVDFEGPGPPIDACPVGKISCKVYQFRYKPDKNIIGSCITRRGTSYYIHGLTDYKDVSYHLLFTVLRPDLSELYTDVYFWEYEPSCMFKMPVRLFLDPRKLVFGARRPISPFDRTCIADTTEYYSPSETYMFAFGQGHLTINAVQNTPLNYTVCLGSIMLPDYGYDMFINRYDRAYSRAAGGSGQDILNSAVKFQDKGILCVGTLNKSNDGGGEGVIAFLRGVGVPKRTSKVRDVTISTGRITLERETTFMVLRTEELISASIPIIE